MTVRLFVFVVCCFFFIFPQSASAHLPGQPPYFKINDKYSDLYPMQSVFPDIELPQDISQENYLINQQLTFEIDKEKLKQVVPEEILNRTTFKWKFGDGQTGEGWENTHAYKKIGSYVLEIYVIYTENGHTLPETLIQSVLFHVLPDKNYQLPKSVILVNGKAENTDPSKNVFRLNLQREINFDASSSVAPSSKIVSYLWGFGDGKTSKGPHATHTFSQQSDFVSSGIRITDANGFFADADVGIKHDPKAVNITDVPSSKKSTNLNAFWWVILVPVLILIVVLTAWLRKR